MNFPKPTHILKSANVGALLVSHPTNVQYLTGLNLSFGYVLVRGRNLTLYTDSRYSELASEKAHTGIVVKHYKNLETTMKKIETCGFESERVTVAQLALWKRKFKNTKFVQKKGIIEEFRRSKRPDEIRQFRKAQSITKKVLASIPRMLKSGISEKELAWAIEKKVRALGADGLSFDPIVAFGSHTSRPHHQPTNRTLKKGHIVQIDMGAQFNGYCADRSEVFFTAKPTKKQQHVYDVLLKTKAVSVKAAKAGVTTHDLSAIADAELEKEGLLEYFTHALGHGVGLDIHEGVTLSAHGPNRELLAGEIITIEPGVYFEGGFGMRLEEEVIIK